MLISIALELVLLSLSTRQNRIDAVPVDGGFRLARKAERRRPGIWTGTSKQTSAWLRLLSGLRIAAGMLTKGFVFPVVFSLNAHSNQAIYRIGSNRARRPMMKTQLISRRLVKELQGQRAVLRSKVHQSHGFMPPTTRPFATHLALSARRSLNRHGRRTYKIGSGRTRPRSAAASIMPAVTPR